MKLMPLVTRSSTQGNVFRQDEEPPSWVNGDLWVDTDSSPRQLFVNNAGTARLVGSFSTDFALTAWTATSSTVNTLTPGTANKTFYHYIFKFDKSGTAGTMFFRINDNSGTVYSYNVTTGGVTVNSSTQNHILLGTGAGFTTATMIVDFTMWKDNDGNYVGTIIMKSTEGTTAGTQDITTWSSTVSTFTSMTLTVSAGTLDSAETIAEINNV